MNKHRLTVRLDPDTIRKLKVQAAKESISVSELIERLTKDNIKE